MSKPLLTGNPADDVAWLRLRRRRNRLRAWALLAALLLLAAGWFGARGWWRQRDLPRHDYYRALLSGLAEQHYRVTGTTTILKENEQVLEYLSRLYARKAQRDRLPAEAATVASAGVRIFAFQPGLDGWQLYPFDRLAEFQQAPSQTFDKPSGPPLALWLFSRSEQALAVIFNEIPVVDDLVKPGLRIIEPVNQSGAMLVAGEFKSEMVVLNLVYLLPLAQLRLDATDGGIESGAAFDRFIGAVPLLFGIGRRNSATPLRLDSYEAYAPVYDLLPPFSLTLAWAARWVVVPFVLLWLAVLWWRMQRTRQAWQALLAHSHPHEAAQLHFGFTRFLTADLIAVTKQRLDATVEQKHREALLQEESLRREQLKREARHYSMMLAQFKQEEPACDEAWLMQASPAELEEATARLCQQAEQQQAQADREQQASRERARQLLWLESEFDAIPSDKRPAVAEAWTLYEQACAANDPVKRLEMLKSARKLLPKEFRSEPS